MKTILFTTAIIILCLQTIAQPSSTVYYSFSGSATDLSGNGNDGTLYGSASITTKLKIPNNSTSYLSVPVDVINGLDDFTISFNILVADFHTTGTYPTNHIFSGSRSSCVQCFGFSYEKVIDAWKLAMNGNVYTWDDALEEKTIYCISLSRKNDSIQLYKDGILMGTYIDASVIDITSFIIGQEDDCTGGCFATNQCMFGRMDNFQVWNGYYPICNANSKQEYLTETEPEELHIYPNPTQDILHIDTKNESGGCISVYNINGQVLFKKTISKDITEVDVSGMISGLYLITLQYDNIYRTQRLIKE